MAPKLRCKYCKGYNTRYSQAMQSWDETEIDIGLHITCDDCDWGCYFIFDIVDVVDPEGRI